MVRDASTQQTEEMPGKPVSPIFVVALIICSAIILASIYGRRLAEFKSVDTIERPHAFDPRKLSEFGNFQTKVLVGLYVNSYEEFDMIKNHFVMVADIWFLIDPGIVPISVLDKFSFDKGEIVSISAPNTRAFEDKLLVEYTVRVRFSSPLVYTYFPLDEHRVVISLTNKMLMPQVAILMSENRYFNASINTATFGWQRLDTAVEYGYKTIFFDAQDKTEQRDYSVVNFMMDFKRTSYRYIISIILPLLTIFYLSFFSFSMTGNTRVSLPAAGLTGILSFRFVIDALSPSAGYFLLSDYLFLLFLFATFLSLIVVLFDTFFLELSIFYKKMVMVLLHMVVIVANFYLVS